MFTKSSDRIAALLPFLFILLAGIIGIKSNVDLFSYLHYFSSPRAIDTTQHIVRGAR